MKEYKDDEYIYDALDLIDLDDLNEVYEDDEEADSEAIKLKVMEKIEIESSIAKANTKKGKLSKFRKSFVAALILLAVTGTVMGGEISRANRINENTSIEAYGMDVNREALEKYSTKVDKVVTDKGVSLKVKNVLVDGEAIWIDYDIYSDKYNFSKDVWPKEMDNVTGLNIKLNGKEIVTRGSGSGQIVNKNTFSYTQVIELDDFDFKGKINVEVFTNEIGDEKGNWKLGFEIDSKDIAAETKEYKVGKFFVFNKSLYRIKSVVINPIQTTVYYSYFGKNYSMISLDLQNEDGKELSFTGGEESSKFFMKKGKMQYSSANIKGDTLNLIVKESEMKKQDSKTSKDKVKEIKININK